MDELNMLIQEKSNIRSKISGAMKELKGWFEKKKDDVKDYFNTLTNKVKEVKNDTLHNQGISKDIVIGGKVVFKQGTTVSNVSSKILRLMTEIKNEVNKTLSECKKGIKYIISNQYENAVHCKEIVLSNLKKITIIGSVIVSGIGAITIGSKIDIKERNARLADIELNRIADKRKSDHASFGLMVLSKKRQDDERELAKQIEYSKKVAKIEKEKQFQDLVNRNKKLDNYIRKSNSLWDNDPREKERQRKRAEVAKQVDDYKKRISEKRDREEAERQQRRQASQRDNDNYLNDLNDKRERDEEERRRKRAEVAKQVEAYKKRFQ